MVWNVIQLASCDTCVHEKELESMKYNTTVRVIDVNPVLLMEYNGKFKYIKHKMMTLILEAEQSASQALSSHVQF